MRCSRRSDKLNIVDAFKQMSIYSVKKEAIFKIAYLALITYVVFVVLLFLGQYL